MLFIGIDEAGYGPLLGPLVVAGAAFRADAALAPEDLGGLLADAAARAGLDVGDSKRLFGVTRDLATLETPILAFLAASAADVARLDDVLVAVGVDPAIRRVAPWYAEEPAAYPLKSGRDEIAAAASRLAAALAASGVEFVGFAADVVDERRFNAALADGNKADALFVSASSVFDRLAARRVRGETMAAVFDRHGGRRYYATALQRRWPETLAWALAESPRRSDYRLHFDGAPSLVRFEVEADGSFAQVGLASMLAKYLREAFMSMFNAYFCPRLPGVAPTEGYVQDGRRWLKAGRDARLALGVRDADIVRRR